MSTSLDKKIQQIIVSANKYAWDHYEIVLDLSEISITKIDSVIQIEKLKAKESDATKFDITRSSRVWGVYLGEIIRNTVGGVWLIEEGDLILQVSEVNILPIQHVSRILGGQSNLTVYSYYKDFCKKIGDGIIVGEREQASEFINHQLGGPNSKNIDEHVYEDNEFEDLIKEIFPSSEVKPKNQNNEYDVFPEEEKSSLQSVTYSKSDKDGLVNYRIWLAVIGIGIIIGTFLPWITVKEGYIITKAFNGFTIVPGLVTFLLGAVAIFSSIYSKIKKPDWIVTISSISVLGIPIFTLLVKNIWYYESCFADFFGDEDAICPISELGTGFYFSFFFIIVMFIFTQVTRTRRKSPQ